MFLKDTNEDTFLKEANNKIDISIVILTRNRARLLKECLASLINQDYSKDRFEILVCDDGSQDDTKVAVGAFLDNNCNVRYLYQPRRGIGAARNLGITNSSGDFVAFVADDYILNEQYVKTAVSFFKECPEASILRFKIIRHGGNIVSKAHAYCYEMNIEDIIYDSSKGEKYFVRRNWELPLNLNCGKGIKASYYLPASGAAVFRKDLFKRVGFFNQALPLGEDSDMGWRLKKERTAIFYYPLPLVKRRYVSSLSVSLINCYREGKFFYSFKKRHPDFYISFPGNYKNTAIFFIDIFSHAMNYIFIGGIINFLRFLPFLILFKSFYCLGVFCGRYKK